MKAAINQWAFPEGMATADALSLAKTIGFESFEVCVGLQGPVPLDASQSDVTAIRRHASNIGIELSSIGCGLGWDYPLTSPDPKVRADRIIPSVRQNGSGVQAG